MKYFLGKEGVLSVASQRLVVGTAPTSPPAPSSPPKYSSWTTLPESEVNRAMMSCDDRTVPIIVRESLRKPVVVSKHARAFCAEKPSLAVTLVYMSRIHGLVIGTGWKEEPNMPVSKISPPTAAESGLL
jgi:hypothetical protein